MSTELGAKGVRRVEAATGLDVLRAWATRGPRVRFLATAHRHGWLDKATGRWGLEEVPQHLPSCAVLFPEEAR